MLRLLVLLLGCAPYATAAGVCGQLDLAFLLDGAFPCPPTALSLVTVLVSFLGSGDAKTVSCPGGRPYSGGLPGPCTFLLDAAKASFLAGFHSATSLCWKIDGSTNGSRTVAMEDERMSLCCARQSCTTCFWRYGTSLRRRYSPMLNRPVRVEVMIIHAWRARLKSFVLLKSVMKVSSVRL